MNKVEIDEMLGKERFENRDELNQMEMIGIQNFFNSGIARGNLIYTDNYLYPEEIAKVEENEIVHLFMYRGALYLSTINLKTKEEKYFKMN